MVKFSWKTLLVPGVALLLIGGGGVILNAVTEGGRSPYERGVLSLSGSVPAGQELFNANCSACHGTEANGWVGPNLHNVKSRKSDLALIRQVTSGKTPPMPRFELNEHQMADLLSYLKSI